MTREEAIKILEYPVKKWSMEWDEREDGLSYYEALDLAISTLRKQEQLDKVSQGSSQDKPLTLDELRRMEGQPVYIVENTEYWAIVNSFDQAGVYLLSYGNPDDYGYFGFYGKTWLAYRQKPEEDDHDERKENENV